MRRRLPAPPAARCDSPARPAAAAAAPASRRCGRARAPSCSSTIAPGRSWRSMRAHHASRIGAHARRSRARSTPRAPGRASCSDAGDERIGHADHGAEPARRAAGECRAGSPACASISARMRRGASAQNQACGCVALWLPMPWPRRTISRTSSGRAARAFADDEERRLRRVRVEQVEHRARCRRTGRRRSSARRGVRVVGRRLSTGLNRRECGHSVAPQERQRGVASSAGSPTCQPQRHHSRDHQQLRQRAGTTTQACGWRGGRCRDGFGMAASCRADACRHRAAPCSVARNQRSVTMPRRFPRIPDAAHVARPRPAPAHRIPCSPPTASSCS